MSAPVRDDTGFATALHVAFAMYCDVHALDVADVEHLSEWVQAQIENAAEICTEQREQAA